jgi:hypothetical protein
MLPVRDLYRYLLNGLLPFGSAAKVHEKSLSSFFLTFPALSRFPSNQ